MRRLTLRRVGGSIGVTIPKELAERFRLGAGDEVFAVPTDEGILVTPYDPEFERAMSAYDRGSRRYRNVLHELEG